MIAIRVTIRLGTDRRGTQRPGLSLNHLIRAQEDRLRDRDAERLRGLQVDHQLELGRMPTLTNELVQFARIETRLAIVRAS